MVCTFCNTKLKTIETVSDDAHTYRLKQCPNCEEKYCTVEELQPFTSIYRKIRLLRGGNRWNESKKSNTSQ